ncbi:MULTISPECIES: NACHT domain-containing NTPase [unclassified Coleofasciculus]|uniref:NACHT domain-containing protein n=1 Tax=Cyanophyceae TaxID=3028117 RepID=UPI001F5488A3|nr:MULTISPECIES: NACHT domain-containing NTPase [unclassified Coleofasciculus]
MEKITGRRRIEIADLMQGCDPENFDRFGLSRVTQKRVPGLEVVNRHSKLMVLGKPGAGKTTFLKYLAMQCISGKFQANQLPVFITLKDFAETREQPDLLEFIKYLFADCGVADTEIGEILQQGRALILLDGLDEVREKDSKQILKQIKNFSCQYPNNPFVITCRIAAQEYTFEKFTDVEIADVEVADFDDEQIQTFVNRWFQAKESELAERFIQQLNSNLPIKELAASPLLLTLLCLAFEESGNFSANRSELYKEGLDTLLKKWDAKRGIERDKVYKNLSIQRKEDLLSKIALITFEKGDYFFKQKAAEQYIIDYIYNLPDANPDVEALQLDSETVLRSIEAQHGLLVERAKGIYSFSHLTFHEYFTAREIVFGTQPLEKRLQNLVNHIAEKRWREVFLLAVGMSPSADLLLQLMKKQIDVLIADDEKLQQFLMWVSQKSVSAEVLYKPAAVRAFYLAFALDCNIYEMTLDTRLAHCLSRDLTSDFGDFLNSNSDRNPFSDLALDYLLLCELRLARNHALSGSGASKYALEPELKRSLKQLQETLKDQQPNPIKDTKRYRLWWEYDGQAWTEQFTDLMIKYRNIGHDWQLNKQQEEILEQYYNANLLLVECLNSDCYVSREVRQEIEDTLLLPIAEIEQRKIGLM